MKNRLGLERKKAVTFDLDGTLVDTVWLWELCVAEIAEDLDIPWAGFGELLGQSLEVVWDQLLSFSSEKIKIPVSELVKRTNSKFLEKIPSIEFVPRDGFWQLAGELKLERGMKLGLVTNSSPQLVAELLKSMGISDTFDVVVTKEDVKNPKPAPDTYIVAAKKLGVKPSEMLTFEDSPAGAISARKAGVDVVVIWDNNLSEFSYPEDIVTHVGDFDDLIGNLDADFDEQVKEYIRLQTEKAKSI